MVDWCKQIITFQVLRTSSNETDVTSLKPVTVYVVSVDVCTSVGCTRSPVVYVTTASELPQGLVAPEISNITSTAMDLNWSNPHIANGDIVR